jgi:hypothetical protein
VADLDALFTEFIERHLAGENPDPFEVLDRLEGSEREELAELIDAYYVDAPPRPWDPDAYEGSSAERIAESVERSLAGVSGGWPVLLPRLRDRARLTRERLVDSLAERLGVGDRREKVDAYYHQMEWGQLPSQGVDDRVLDALGELVGASARWLRAIGRPLAGPGEPGEAADAVFARTAVSAADHEAVPAAPAKRAEDSGGDEEWDEVDQLFRGG